VPDVVRPGWFDFRPIGDRMPWSDVKGKRCLDVWTFDGEPGYRGTTPRTAPAAAVRRSSSSSSI
jgi:hypothetical protein